MLHKLSGTKARSSHAKVDKALVVEGSPIGKPPAWLGSYGKQEWKRLAEHQTYSRVLNPLFFSALLDYCILFDRMIRTEKGESKQGDPKFTATERQLLGSLRMQLGITPASANKVRTPEPTQTNQFLSLRRG